MRKVKEHKNFVIATDDKTNKANGYDEYSVFTKEEYSMGEGLRYSEIETGSIQEAIDFIDCY